MEIETGKDRRGSSSPPPSPQDGVPGSGAARGTSVSPIHIARGGGSLGAGALSLPVCRPACAFHWLTLFAPGSGLKHGCSGWADASRCLWSLAGDGEFLNLCAELVAAPLVGGGCRRQEPQVGVDTAAATILSWACVAPISN